MKTISYNTEEYIQKAYEYANNINNLQVNSKKYLQIQQYKLFQDYDSVKEYNKILQLINSKIL